MGTDVDAALAAQGLDASDLEANRAGRVSDRQLAMQVAVRRRGARGVQVLALFAIVAAGSISAVKAAQGADTGLVVFMAILGLVLAAIPLTVYYAFRFADPARVAACTVTKIAHADVGVILPYRGVYAVALNGQRYSGFGALTRTHLGAHADAYVVQEHRIVVALEPVD